MSRRSTTKPTWELVGRVCNGHRFFRDTVSRRIALADQSGHYPEHTDDGVLWLDPRRPLTVTLGGREYAAVSYPLIADRDGRECWSGDGLACLSVVLPLWEGLGGEVELKGVSLATLQALVKAVTP